MERVHPRFIENGMNKAKKNANFEEFKKEINKGVEYWLSTLAAEIGPVRGDEIPLIIASLREMADAYEEAVPSSKKTSELLRRMVDRHTLVLKTPVNDER